MRHVGITIALAASLLLSACAPIALTAGSLVGSAGVNHTMNGIAYKTFTASPQGLRIATLKTFNRMEINVTKDEKSEKGWDIAGTAADRRIEIELEELTPATTRMRVVTHKGEIFFKDSATSTEIIIQTAQVVDSDAIKAAAAAEAAVKATAAKPKAAPKPAAPKPAPAKTVSASE